jgi:hypothetical protein
MADSTISGLAHVVPLDGTEVLPVDQGIVTKKATVSDLATYLLSLGLAATPQTTTTASYTAADGAATLAVAASAGFIPGSYAVLTQGANRLSFTVSSKPDSTHVAVSSASPRPTGEAANGTVFTSGAILTLSGAPGSQGLAGTNGTNGAAGTNGTNGAAGTNGTNGAAGTNGTNGTNGSTPLTTTTGSYTQASGAVAIPVADATAFVVGADALLSSGANKLHGTVTAKAIGSVTFQRYGTIPAGETADGTVYAAGSTLAVTGLAGLNGAAGTAGTNGTNGTNGSAGTNGVNGSNPITTLTASYTQAAGGTATSIAVGDSTAFAVGVDAILANGASYVHGKVTAKADSTHATFTPYTTATAGDTAAGTVYAVGSTLAVSGTPGAAYFDLAVSVTGTPAANDKILTFIVTRAFQLPANLTGSKALAGTNATSNFYITMYKNGTNIGTVNFLSGVSVGTFTFTSAVSFTPGDRFVLQAPAPADATLADFGFTLVGVLL